MHSFLVRPVGLLFLFLSLAPSGIHAAETAVRPLPQAHAHNDYEHSRPLWDALDHGFCSVEADIHLVDDQLLVGHDPEDLLARNTLETLYLEPLYQRVEKNGGAVFEPGLPFTLLVDFKTAAEPTYRALELRLAHYKEMLTEFSSSGIKPGAVTIILTGNRPTATVAAEAQRWVGVDGRLPDLGGSRPVSLLPLISDHWPSHFTWDGTGTFPPEEKEKLLTLVKQAHTAGQRLRFWATADNRAMWQALAEAKVDVINTDDLAGLQEFLQARQPADR